MKRLALALLVLDRRGRCGWRVDLSAHRRTVSRLQGSEQSSTSRRVQDSRAIGRAARRGGVVRDA